VLRIALAAACLLSAAAAPALAAKAAHGRPDLQGVWTNATLTQLERPAVYGDRVVLTQPETDALEKKNDALVALGNKPTDPKASVKELPSDCSGGRGDNCNYNAAWTDPGTRVMRVGGQPRSSFITFPANGRIPALTPQAQASGAGLRRAALPAGVRQNDNPETRSLGERCLTSFGYSAGPVMLPLLYNNTYQIVQTGDQLAILEEMDHDVRTVRMNARTHLPPVVRPWMGDSIGRWEGDTLVIETTNFTDRTAFRGSSEFLKVTERLTYLDADTIKYQFTIEDPHTWDTAWAGEYPMKRTTFPMYEYACHEGNYGMANNLSGARATEKK
jgi:hypothetical protein